MSNARRNRQTVKLIVIGTVLAFVYLWLAFIVGIFSSFTAGNNFRPAPNRAHYVTNDKAEITNLDSQIGENAEPVKAAPVCEAGKVVKSECSACNTVVVTKSNSDCTEYKETITSGTCSNLCPVVAPAPVPAEKPNPPVEQEVKTTCCKICTKGKACGDSCISKSYTCHKGPGCACDG